MIRNHDGNIITEEKFRETWGAYFNTLHNRENEHYALCEIAPTKGPVQNTALIEVKKTVERKNNGKAAGGSGLNIGISELSGTQTAGKVYGDLK